MTHPVSPAFIAAACRTAVVPRNGAFAVIEAYDLAAPVIRALLEVTGLEPSSVGRIIMGNALYGGGNPARMAGLAAGLPAGVSALTLDSQCCAGLDAIAIGSTLIASGQARAVIAGGLESYSRAPIRQRRPLVVDEAPAAYDRPPFTPWPHADPDMIEAAAALAAELGIDRRAQEAFAIASHARALAGKSSRCREIVAVGAVDRDVFARPLSSALCRRLPPLAGDPDHALTAATVAVEADAAAAVLLVDEALLSGLRLSGAPIRVAASASSGGDPVRPGLAAMEPARKALAASGVSAKDLAAVEIMEAFAAQAMSFISSLRAPENVVNMGGGALARGHPIGASGAILAVRLFHELQIAPTGALGLAAIAAAGGLGSALMLHRP